VVVGAALVAVGISLHGPLGLVQASWFGAMGREWGALPLQDQYAGALVLVGAGVALAVVVTVVALVRVRTTGRADVAGASTASRPTASASAERAEGAS
jgi:hypothetical protein